jgi:hypothetical protein
LHSNSGPFLPLSRSTQWTSNRPLGDKKPREAGGQPDGRPFSTTKKRMKMMNTNYNNFLVAVVIFATTSPLFAYDQWSLPNLVAPTAIQAPALEADFHHQFLGHVGGTVGSNNALQRLFGLADMADVAIGLRAVVWQTAQVYVSYDDMQMFNDSHYEYAAGAAYAVAVPQLYMHVQGDGQVFSYSSLLTFPEKRRTGTFVQLSLQNDPIFDRARFLVDGGYDFDKKKFGLGLGLDVRVYGDFSAYGEVFPIVDKTDRDLFQANMLTTPYSIGGKITTPGHQFFVFIGNAEENGARHLMRGTVDKYMRFGFSIKRLWSFKKS